MVEWWCLALHTALIRKFLIIILPEYCEAGVSERFSRGLGGLQKNYPLYQNKSSARVKEKQFYIQWYQQNMILVIKSVLNELMKIISFAPKNRQKGGESERFFKIKIKGFPRIKIPKKMV